MSPVRVDFGVTLVPSEVQKRIVSPLRPGEEPQAGLWDLGKAGKAYGTRSHLGTKSQVLSPGIVKGTCQNRRTPKLVVLLLGSLETNLKRVPTNKSTYTLTS